MEKMKIKIITHCHPKDTVVPLLVSTISHHLSEKAMVNAEEEPDIVHVLGAWNNHTFKAVTHYADLKIPVVYSPLGGITPWMVKAKRNTLHGLAQLRSQRAAIVRANSLVAFSKTEVQMARKWIDDQKILELRNAVITNKYPISTLIAELLRHYEQVIATHDRTIREHIDTQVNGMHIEDDNIRTLLFKILYLQYEQHRGTIHHPTLQDLSQYLIELDFDEDLFVQTVRHAKLLKFVSFLQDKMSKECGLTEGFMPIPLKS